MPDLNRPAQALRAFNRFYTGRIGVLGAGLLASRFSLTESRLLWELAHHPGRSASELSRDIALDAGYISRLLASLRGQGLVRAQRSAQDGRQWHLSLSVAGTAGRRSIAARTRRAPPTRCTPTCGGSRATSASRC